MQNLKINIKKINNEKITPVRKLTNKDNRPIKGESICNELYSQIFLVAKKNSGKSTVLHNMITKFADKKTKIIAFCSSLYQDDIWKSIRKMCKDRNFQFNGFTSIVDHENNENILRTILDDIQEDMKEKDEEDDKHSLISIAEEDEQELKGILFDNSEEETKETKNRKSKYLTPEYLFIFDDISEELHNTTLISLLKKNRHFKSKVIISSQYPLDLVPQSRKQIDLWCLFKGETREKLEKIYKDIDADFSFEVFYSLYLKATENKFSFFYCDSRHQDYRIKFDNKFVL